MPKMTSQKVKKPAGSNRVWVVVVALALISGLIGGLASQAIYQNWSETTNGRIKNLYEDEMAVFVSPTTLKKMIDQKDSSYTLVDLRSKAEYDKEHIITAINIPAVSMNADQIVAAFKKLPQNKQIIVHCYSASCTLGRHVGQLLAEHGIYVKELDIGWSEWRYFWPLWNPGAKQNDGKPYIATGSAASANQPITPCTSGEFGC